MRYLPCGLFAGRDSLWKFNFSILFYDDILSPVKHGGGGRNETGGFLQYKPSTDVFTGPCAR